MQHTPLGCTALCAYRHVAANHAKSNPAACRRHEGNEQIGSSSVVMGCVTALTGRRSQQPCDGGHTAYLHHWPDGLQLRGSRKRVAVVSVEMAAAEVAANVDDGGGGCGECR